MTKYLFVPVSLMLLLLPIFASAATCPNLYRTLSFGTRGSDVVELQTFLITQGDLAAGNSTGYFGRMTEAAVQKFQVKHSLVSSGTAATTGFGAVGPRTRAKIVGMCGGEARETPPGPPSPASMDFSAYPLSGAAPLTVNLFYSSDQTGGEYFVEFGDGTASETMRYIVPPCAPLPSGAVERRYCRGSYQVSHTYARPGTYTARLSFLHDMTAPCRNNPNPNMNCAQGALSAMLGTVTITVTGAGSSSSLSDQMNQIRSEIDKAIGTVASDISQCRTVAIGHKLCGGPGGYLVYSLQSTNESKLKDLVTRYTAFQEEYQRKYQSNLASTCDMTPEPTIEFKSGVCAVAPRFPLMAP